MRLKLFAICAGLAFTVSVPAMAQNNGYNSGYSPYYNNNGNTNTNNQGNTFYNSGSNVAPIPLQQMIAGKNAPSYTYGGTGAKSYTAFGSDPMANVTSIGSLSPEQANYMRQQQARQQQQQQELLEQQGNSSAYQGGAFSQLYNNPFGTKPDTAVTKRRVVYNEKNNPLVEPPRLFNPDQ